VLRVGTALIGLLVLVAGCGGSGAPQGTTSASAEPRIEDRSFHSTAVNGTLHYAIALPPGYDSSGARYPVVYFLHGLPANDQAYKDVGGYADSLAAGGRRAIVVGAQGAREGDTDPEWHDWGPGRNWEAATESELVSWIDGHYRTIAKRSGRAIVGVSAGGYGATLTAIHHPGRYQVIESWSGYFVPTSPEGRLAGGERQGERARQRAAAAREVRAVPEDLLRLLHRRAGSVPRLRGGQPEALARAH
jgi:S-formylglutathione hydrolase FrmB